MQLLVLPRSKRRDFGKVKDDGQTMECCMRVCRDHVDASLTRFLHIVIEEEFLVLKMFKLIGSDCLKVPKLRSEDF